LHTAAGHLQAVSALVEAGKPCEEVIHQLGAVKAALRAIGIRLLVCQLKQSKEVILNGSAELRAAELRRLCSLYSLLAQNSDYESEKNE
jgi:DNA-binding FrmR family transcriptional regulator